MNFFGGVLIIFLHIKLFGAILFFILFLRIMLTQTPKTDIKKKVRKFMILRQDHKTYLKFSGILIALHFSGKKKINK